MRQQMLLKTARRLGRVIQPRLRLSMIIRRSLWQSSQQGPRVAVRLRVPRRLLRLQQLARLAAVSLSLRMRRQRRLPGLRVVASLLPPQWLRQSRWVLMRL